MFPGSPFDPELMGLFQAICQELIQYTPEHFRTAYCIAEQSDRHGTGRLRYRIGSKDFPRETTTTPSPTLHEAVYQLYRSWTKDNKAFPGVEVTVTQQSNGQWTNSVKALNLDAVRRSEGEEDERWQAVYEARKAFYEHQFGPLPDDIQKLMNLMCVWPAGGLFQFAAPKHTGAGICTSFGLSNFDMPTRTKPVDYQHTNEGGHPSYSAKLELRTPRWLPEDVAGYGYEVMIVTPKPETWPLLPVSWVVQMEILKDIDLPDHVHEGKGLTVESVKIGDGSQSADFLIEAARFPWPEQMVLPNGTARLFIATRITRDEMQFALKNGRPALFEKLVRAGIGQVSHLQRPSVIK